MIKTGHLGRIELFSLIVITAVTNVFLSYPQQLALMGGPAGWLVPILSMLICLAVWWMMAPGFKHLQAGDLHAILQKGVGKWMIRFFYVTIILYMIADCSSTIRLFTETVVTTVLPRSPISFVALPFALVIAYFAFTGVEGLTRIAWLLLPVLTFGLLALLLLNINWMDMEYITPYLGKGIKELSIGGGVFTGVFLNIICLVILASRLREPKDAVKIGFWSIVAVGLTYSAVTLVFIMVFPPEASMRAPFPLYQLGRLIYIGRFITRLEAAFVFIWVAMAVIKLSFCLWVSTFLYGTLFQMPVNRPLVIPMSLLVYSLSFITRNFPEMLELNTKYVLRWAWPIVIGIPLLTVVWMRYQKRKEEKTDEQTAQAS
ncbi:MAG: GerAB/ArcD/ProY family transporter [Tumebacillaceae bacterium]